MRNNIKVIDKRTGNEVMIDEFTYRNYPQFFQFIPRIIVEQPVIIEETKENIIIENIDTTQQTKKGRKASNYFEKKNTQ